MRQWSNPTHREVGPTPGADTAAMLRWLEDGRQFWGDDFLLWRVGDLIATLQDEPRPGPSRP